MTDVYYVVRTIADDGQVLTHLPIADRIVFSSTDYGVALHEAKQLRKARWRHKTTGEERVFSAAETDASADASAETVWGFIRVAQYVESLGYAIVVEEDALSFYEPTGTGWEAKA